MELSRPMGLLFIPRVVGQKLFSFHVFLHFYAIFYTKNLGGGVGVFLSKNKKLSFVFLFAFYAIMGLSVI